MSVPAYNLRARAVQAMQEAGFEPTFSPDALQQTQHLTAETLPAPTPDVQDLRSLLWSSIDNDSSRDLDQLEWVEALPDGGLRVLVAVADVDVCVAKDTPVDAHAHANTTSVYTGVETFAMLPEPLSTGLTSLLPDQDRRAIVIMFVVDADGSITARDVYAALVRNRAKLTYDATGPWLEGNGPLPDAAHISGLDAQLRLQNDAAKRLTRQRQQAGALDFDTVEAQPIMQGDHVVDLAVPHKNQARRLIENFMVAANTIMADFLADAGIVSIQRVVRAPARWPRIVEVAAQYGETLPAEPSAPALSQFLARRRAADPVHFPDLSLTIVKLLGPGEYAVVRSRDEPEGHFGLAVTTYTHSTAPNRRFADLVIQRLLKATVHKAPPPYTVDELDEIARRCTERENAARKVERTMRKVAAAALFADRIGQHFDAIVTGASDKGVYVRTLNPPVEGRLMQGERGADVGDKIRVRLLVADPQRGFIDFARE